MNELVDFFLEPYHSAPVINIIFEFVAALFGIISVFYARKENILVFPTGIISTAIYVYLLSQWALYGDLIINIYYTLMSIYGWYMWLKVVDNKDNHISISRTSSTEKVKAFGIFIFTSIFVIIVYRYFNVMPNNLGFNDSVEYAWSNFTSNNIDDFRKAMPYMDTFTTGTFFAAMWLMANKKLESWTLWIAGNIVSIPLYFVKGFGFTGIQYTVFLILAIFGYTEWKKQIDKSKHA